MTHNPIALAVHRANHQQTEHYVADVFEVDPVLATKGQPVGILRASPERCDLKCGLCKSGG